MMKIHLRDLQHVEHLTKLLPLLEVIPSNYGTR